MSLRVGTAGWSYQDWKGAVYPKPAPRGFDPLVSLSGFLDCIEVNSSFYRIPDPKTVTAWVDRTADRPEFRFTVKLWQGFTHADESAPGLVGSFLEAVEPMRRAGRLLAVLVQFPWRFTDSPAARQRLGWLAERLAPGPLALEVRHRSWLVPDAVRQVQALGYSFVNIDMPSSQTGVYPTALVTGPIGYVRLHGRSHAWFDRRAGRDDKYDYLYRPWELEKWMRRIEQVRARADETVVITNNHFRGQAVANAVQLRQMLGLPVRPIPEVLQEAFPFLKGE